MQVIASAWLYLCAALASLGEISAPSYLQQRLIYVQLIWFTLQQRWIFISMEEFAI